MVGTDRLGFRINIYQQTINGLELAFDDTVSKIIRNGAGLGAMGGRKCSEDHWGQSGRLSREQWQVLVTIGMVSGPGDQC